MDSYELRELLRRPEGLKLDFKRKLYKLELPEPDKKKQWNEFIKDILALANGNVGVTNETGHLIFGADDNLNAYGTRDLIDVDDIKPAILNMDRI